MNFENCTCQSAKSRYILKKVPKYRRTSIFPFPHIFNLGRLQHTADSRILEQLSTTNHRIMVLAPVRTAIGSALLVVLLVLSTSLPHVCATSIQTSTAEVPGRYICQFKTSANRNSAVAALSQNGGFGPRPAVKSFSLMPAALMVFSSDEDAQAWMNGRSDLEYCEQGK